jgi:hypothetical protein
VRGDEMFMWVSESDGGKWGQITAFIPVIDAHGPLTARSRAVAEAFRPLAQTHAKRSGSRVALRVYRFVETLEVIDPNETGDA